ncbi:hypothetical protein [Streptomyces rubradiris]|uniref:Uncharacterized protein n=1 Tax=Streptomyces rubradiris TaxID=285531 RepID=A0ABQ3R3I3_STRRR|nr:hypothetical protein [Streptomyces rubradiris]GHH30205.1 hypothetical protein GCM10018792_76390 [Streptomyces rubradiris]GHI50420.1 hypothetical protein Srubr_02660 [Streptomyces rubradiris]
MLATPERIRGDGGLTEMLVWHKPVGRVIEEFQAIACSDTEGIVMPWPKQDVPLKLDKPGERWCSDCLAIIRSA